MYSLQIGKSGFYVTADLGISRDLKKIWMFNSKHLARDAYRKIDWSGLNISEVHVQMPVLVLETPSLQLAAVS